LFTSRPLASGRLSTLDLWLIAMELIKHQSLQRIRLQHDGIAK